MPQKISPTIQRVFDLVNREIWIVTAAANGRTSGLVATWVSAASIDPETPTVLIGLAPNHFTTELVDQSGGFAVHLLDVRQHELVWRFALASGRDTDKLGDLDHKAGATGSPILAECLAWLDCHVISQYDAGDRVFFWANVVEGKTVSEGQTLREKDVLAAATPDQLAQLAAARAADIRSLAQLRQRWLETTAFSCGRPVE